MPTVECVRLLACPPACATRVAIQSCSAHLAFGFSRPQPPREADQRTRLLRQKEGWALCRQRHKAPEGSTRDPGRICFLTPSLVEASGDKETHKNGWFLVGPPLQLGFRFFRKHTKLVGFFLVPLYNPKEQSPLKRLQPSNVQASP